MSHEAMDTSDNYKCLPMPQPDSPHPFPTHGGQHPVPVEDTEHDGAGRSQLYSNIQGQYYPPGPQQGYVYPPGGHPPVSQFCYCHNAPPHNHPDGIVYQSHPYMQHNVNSSAAGPTPPYPTDYTTDYRHTGLHNNPNMQLHMNPSTAGPTPPYPTDYTTDYRHTGLHNNTTQQITTVPNPMHATIPYQYDGQIQQTLHGPQTAVEQAQSYPHASAQPPYGPGISQIQQGMTNDPSTDTVGAPPEQHPNTDPKAPMKLQPSSPARSGHSSSPAIPQGETRLSAADSGTPLMSRSNPDPQFAMKLQPSSPAGLVVGEGSGNDLDSRPGDGISDLMEGFEKLNVNEDDLCKRNMATDKQKMTVGDSDASEAGKLNNNEVKEHMKTEERNFPSVSSKTESQQFSQFEGGCQSSGAGTRHAAMEYLDKFLLSGLKPNISEETLTDFAEVVSECEVTRIEYTPDQTTAVITVDPYPDWDSMEKKVKKRKLENETMRIQRIAHPQSICVHGSFNRNQEDLFRNYFENEKSGNKKWQVTKVQIKEDLVVVTFESPEAVEAVLSQPTHLVAEKSWNVQIFYTDIGYVQERSKMIHTALISSMMLGEVRLLRVTGFLDTLTTDFRHLIEASVEGDTRVKLKGTEAAINTATDEITQFQQKIKRVKLDCSVAKKKFLESESGGSYMMEGLTQKDIKSAWGPDANTIDIFAMSERDLQYTVSWIMKHIKEKKFIVPPMKEDAFDEKFKSLQQKLEEEYPMGSFSFEFSHDSSCIDVVAQHEVSYDVFELIQCCLTEPVTTETTEVTFQKCQLRFIQEHMQDAVNHVKSEYKTNVELQVNKCLLKVSGERGMVEKTRMFFDDLRRKIPHTILTLGSEESENLLQSGHFQCLLEHVERTETCVISHIVQSVSHNKVVDTSVKASGATGGRRAIGHREDYGNHTGQRSAPNQKPSSSSSSEYVPSPDLQDNKGASGGAWQTVHTRSKRAGRKFVTEKPRITIHVKKGMIAAEEADVIVNTVGKGMMWRSGAISRSIVEAGGRKLQKECESFKDLNEGTYVVTRGGNLSCGHVFHCCLPHARDVTAGEIILRLMTEMLKHADTLKVKTISIPALGTGGLGYDPEVVASTMYNSVQHYEEKTPHSSIKDVRFVIYPHNEIVWKAFAAVEKQVNAVKGAHAQSGKAPSQSRHHPKICLTEIAREKVDIIVNTSNSLLNLNHGAVAKSLVQLGGFSIQFDCNTYIRKKNHLPEGEFAVTNGGTLTCKKIYHCCLPSYKGETERMKAMVMDMLKSADKHKNTSIAFPALGTGNLGYPRKEVAKTMFDVVYEFWRHNPEAKLVNVRFVLHKDDVATIKAFREEETQRKSSPPPVPSRSSKPGSSSRNSSVHHPPVSPEQCVFHLDPIKVVVKHGDISKEKVDAVINPLNRDLSFKNGSVSRALFAVGGKNLENDTKVLGERFKKEGIANVLMKNGVRVCNVDRQRIEMNQEKVILACLKNSDTVDDKIIAFPLLLRGSVAEKMAEDLHRALCSFLKLPKPTVMEEVRVVVYDVKDLDPFRSKFEELMKGNSHPRGERDQQLVEDQKQVTFTLWSDQKESLNRARLKLKQFCEMGKVKTSMKIPSTVTKENVSTLGIEYQRVQICFNKDETEIQMKGEAVRVLQAIDAIHRLFKRQFDQWQHQIHEAVEDELLFPENSGKSIKSNNPYRNIPCNSKEPITYQDMLVPYETPKSPRSIGPEWQGNSTQKPEATAHGAAHMWQVDMFEKKTSHTDFKQPEGATWIPDQQDRQSYNQSGPEERPDSSATGSLKSFIQSANKMKWFFLDPDAEALAAYDEGISNDIEQSYLHGENTHKLPLDEESGTQFIVNFKTMEEYPERDPSDKVEVLRREEIDTGKKAFPKTWDPMETGVKVVALKQTDAAYKEVEEHITKSCGNLDVSIVKVERVQNEELFRRYMAKKGENASPREEKLWYHCNTTDSINLINKHGVNLNFCRNQHEPLGEGIYFSAFDPITTTHTDGSQYAYLCLVLVGQYAKGGPDFRDPPPRPADGSSFYHSVVDDVGKPSTYVVFSDAQVFPEYLVTYKINRE